MFAGEQRDAPPAGVAGHRHPQRWQPCCRPAGLPGVDRLREAVPGARRLPSAGTAVPLHRLLSQGAGHPAGFDAATGGIRLGGGLQLPVADRCRRRQRPGGAGGPVPRRRQRLHQRLRGGGLRRFPQRLHRPDPAWQLQLRGEGGERRGGWRGGRDHLQPGQHRGAQGPGERHPGRYLRGRHSGAVRHL
ncbi:hypothetical protein D9M71_115200 [compost metagenome]